MNIPIYTKDEMDQQLAKLSRMREALNKIIGMDSHIDATPRGNREVVYGDFAKVAKAAL